jgi:ATP-dependent DNA ligase
MFDIPVINDEPAKKGSRRSGIMLCYPFEEKRLATWKAPYIIQPKLDGVRCRAIITPEEVTLLSSEQHIISHVPHINEELRQSFPDTNIELDGELYCHGLHFQEITKRVNASKIEYHIFDIIKQGVQIDRTAELNKWGFFNTAMIKVVPSALVRDIKEVMELYSNYVDNGYEGFVIRDTYGDYQRKRYTGMMKFKPHQWDSYLIVGTQEEISIDGVAKGTLGAFICTSSEGTIFNVGTGLTRDQRVEYWKIREELIGRKLKVKYQALTQGNKIPRFPVALEVL